jgi:putative ABC transport system substrate-binding protein
VSTTRRNVIALFGGATVPWPPTAHAQQAGRMRRVGVLMAGAANDPAWHGYAVTFRESLAKFGWVEGRNLRTDVRFGGGDASRLRVQAAELVKALPEVILTASVAATAAVQQETQTIPIVAAGLGDLNNSAAVLVKNIARPEGNGISHLAFFDGGQVAGATQGSRTRRDPGRGDGQP